MTATDDANRESGGKGRKFELKHRERIGEFDLGRFGLRRADYIQYEQLCISSSTDHVSRE